MNGWMDDGNVMMGRQALKQSVDIQINECKVFKEEFARYIHTHSVHDI